MRLVIIFVFFFFSLFNSKAQTNLNPDSLVVEICKTVKTESLKSDSATLLNALSKHIKAPNSPEDSSYFKLLDYCLFRLQRQCPEFKIIADRIQPGKGDWKTVSGMTKPSVSKTDCNDFFKISKFKYFESDGNTTNVVITNTEWTDYFKDGTTSNLLLKRESDAEFVITFLKSNNVSRKNFSKPGDQYRYTILKRDVSYYEMMVEIIGIEQKMIFKLYY